MTAGTSSPARSMRIAACTRAACSSVSWSRTAGLLGMTQATIVPLGAAETGAASSCFRREARLLVAGLCRARPLRSC